MRLKLQLLAWLDPEAARSAQLGGDIEARLETEAVEVAVAVAAKLAPELIAREPLMKAATQEFHVDGTWADPRVVRVERNATASAGAAPAPAAEPATR